LPILVWDVNDLRKPALVWLKVNAGVNKAPKP